jgi:segregation and condensation protein B
MTESSASTPGTTATAVSALLTEEQVAAHIVALLFAADGPVGVVDLAKILEARRPAIERALKLLVERPPLGLLVQRHGDEAQLVTAPASARFVRRLRGLADHTRLSRAALEVLAVVAYRQPVTRAEIEAIRGVNGDRALTTLLTRGLVEEVGRKETIGRPVMFGTTLAFLEQLGLPSLDALPAVPEATGDGNQGAAARVTESGR